MQVETTAGVVPIKHQIADAIRIRITSGDLKPGDPLPTIAELGKRWRCAPGVAREALDTLKSEGRITATRGKRAVVRTPPRRIRLSIKATQAAKDLVLQPRQEREVMGAIEMTAGLTLDQVDSTHRYSTVPADEELAAEFGIQVGTMLQRRDYEMTERETAHRVSWSMSHIPLNLIESNPALLDGSNEPWPGGHQHQLYTVGIEIDRFTRSVTAIQSTPGDRQAWGMESGVPLLRVRSRSVDIQDRVVEISDALYPADRTELEFSDQLERWPAGHPDYDPRAE